MRPDPSAAHPPTGPRCRARPGARSEQLVLLLCIATVGMVLWLTAFAPDDDPQPLRVLVASSLVDVVDDLADAWTAENGTRIEVVAGGSNHLAAQVRDGAPADAFLSADAALLTGLAGPDGPSGANPIRELAHNHLVVARPADGPTRDPADLHDRSLVLVACAPEVPCGGATTARFGDLPVDSYEASARAVVTRLTLDEADLGVVYATDVAGHAGLVPAWPQEPTCPCVTYAVLPLTDDGARFVAFLASDRSRGLFTEHGFTGHGSSGEVTG